MDIRLSFFSSMVDHKTIDYYRYEDESLRAYVMYRPPISAVDIYNKLSITKTKYNNARKNISSALDKMNLTKSISKFNEIKIKKYMLRIKYIR